MKTLPTKERRVISVVTACDGALRRAAAGDRDETAVALKMLLDLIVKVPAIGELLARLPFKTLLEASLAIF